MASSFLLCLVGEWTGHHWQDPRRACSYAEEHKAGGNGLSDCGSSGGGLSTSRAGKPCVFFFLKSDIETIPCFKTGSGNRNELMLAEKASKG